MTASLALTLSPEQLAELAELIAGQIHLTASAPAPLKLAYTIPEAAAVSACTEWDIRTAIRRGELLAKQAGARGRYTIHHAALDSWLRGVPNSSLSAPGGRGQRKASDLR